MQWFYETVVLLHELLTQEGTIYVHFDYHVGSYAKAVMDEVFGREHEIAQVIWKRQTAHSDSHSYANLHDTIYVFSKSESYTFNTQYIPYSEKHIAENYRYKDEKGVFALGQMKAPHNRGPRYEWNGIVRHWSCTFPHSLCFLHKRHFPSLNFSWLGTASWPRSDDQAQ